MVQWHLNFLARIHSSPFGSFELGYFPGLTAVDQCIPFTSILRSHGGLTKCYYCRFGALGEDSEFGAPQ